MSAIKLLFAGFGRHRLCVFAAGELREDVLDAGPHIEDIFWEKCEHIQGLATGLCVFEGDAEWGLGEDADLYIEGNWRRATAVEAMRLVQGKAIWDEEIQPGDCAGPAQGGDGR